MTNRLSHGRQLALAVGAVAVVALAAMIAVATSATAAATASCKGISFTVLHNDTSGGVTLPAGKYTVSSPNLGCKTASSYFTRFLDHYNKAIPGWTGKSTPRAGAPTPRTTARPSLP